MVDDEASVRDVMAAVLMDAGYSVQAARDGRIALAMIDDAPRHLIITNVMVPHLDGWTLLNRVGDWTPALPVILMSADDWLRATDDAHAGSRRLPGQAVCHR